MKVVRRVEDWKAGDGSVVSIGNFDGLHRGHRRILSVAQDHARRLSVPVVAVTFEPHPLTVIAPSRAPKRLTNVAQKLALLGTAGVNVAVVLESTPALLGLEAEAFLRDVVVGRFRPSMIVEGRNFGFGKGRRGDIETLSDLADRFGYSLDIVEPVTVALDGGEPQRVSSSLIRKLVTEGRMEHAAAALGRNYELVGIVERGAGRGRKLGFPTINIRAAAQLIPAHGVYAGRSCVDGTDYRCAVNIGAAPTFESSEPLVEAHLLDFSGDVYGRELVVALSHRLRGQRRFDSPDELARQIRADVEAVRCSV